MLLLPLFYFLAMFLFLDGCQEPTNVGETQPNGLLYRCMGVAGYEPGTMDNIIAYFAKNPPICKDGIDLALANGLPKVATGNDSMTVSRYVMDSKCNFLEETSVKSPDQNPTFPMMFSGTTKEGNSFPTGEYYVNFRIEHPDKNSDTTYTKVGLIQNRCAP